MRDKALFEGFRLYAVTDIKDENADILEKADAAYRGGADIVQLRAKGVCDAAVFRLGLKLREIADRHGKLLFVNDRPDIALAVRADGVHLGQEDLPVRAVRQIMAREERPLYIGKSTHSLEQAREAVREKPDYIGIGPVYATPTKSHYEPVGLNVAARVCREMPLPVVAIGGIDPQNLAAVLEAGVRRIAAVRAVFSERDVYEQTRQLRGMIDRYECQHA